MSGVMKMAGKQSYAESKIFFDPVTYVDIMLAAKCCDVEVSGLAEVKKSGDIYTIFGELIIFEQKCSMEGTHFDLSAHGKWIDKMCRSGQQGLIKAARLWWHSHVDMPAHFSTQDRYTIDEVLGGSFDEWWLALVVNKSSHMLLELDVFKPKRLGPVIIEEVSFTEKITREGLNKLLAERRADMQKVIKEKIMLSRDGWLRRKKYESR